ncbi:hypothetical protein EDD16DRAFT_1528373 [Pisolithus croceorrhizus]|nr:hypothetical protein EDD16DRAFT_1528373 [Pisolithus croceorrhizus]
MMGRPLGCLKGENTSRGLGWSMGERDGDECEGGDGMKFELGWAKGLADGGASTFLSMVVLSSLNLPIPLYRFLRRLLPSISRGAGAGFVPLTDLKLTSGRFKPVDFACRRGCLRFDHLASAIVTVSIRSNGTSFWHSLISNYMGITLSRLSRVFLYLTTHYWVHHSYVDPKGPWVFCSVQIYLLPLNVILPYVKYQSLNLLRRPCLMSSLSSLNGHKVSSGEIGTRPKAYPTD